MKKILFISHSMPPYLYPQSIQTGRFLNDLKSRYDVHVLCAGENTPADPTLYPGLYNGIDAAKILKVPYASHAYLDYLKSRLLPLLSKCPDLYAAWAKRAYEACLAAFPGTAFGAIVTFSFPFSLNNLGRSLKNRYVCPWIAHQSDPWADNPFLRYGPLTRPVNRTMERVCFRQADRLAFTCAEAAALYQERYPDLGERISFINHSFDPALFPARSGGGQDRKIIRYIGGFYGDRTAKPLFSAIAKLSPQARRNLRFEIVGANLKTRLLLQKSGLPPDVIAVTGRVNYAESLRLMVESDVLLVIDAPLRGNNIFFPSKLADYIGAGRPVIGISSPGPTERILASLGHACYRHDRIDELVGAFERIAQGDIPVPADVQGRREDYLDTVNGQKLSDIIEHV
jgi:glycosyltransferase involved in cell wall biosynthesis